MAYPVRDNLRMKRNSCRNYPARDLYPAPWSHEEGHNVGVTSGKGHCSRTFRAQQHVVGYYDTG